ncbi:MAG: hypothetical protein IRZ08_06145, partial [Frankia sp.]|nr:hypothetical protein [Frankia sp.]
MTSSSAAEPTGRPPGGYTSPYPENGIGTPEDVTARAVPIWPPVAMPTADADWTGERAWGTADAWGGPPPWPPPARTEHGQPTGMPPPPQAAPTGPYAAVDSYQRQPAGGAGYPAGGYPGADVGAPVNGNAGDPNQARGGAPAGRDYPQVGDPGRRPGPDDGFGPPTGGYSGGYATGAVDYGGYGHGFNVGTVGAPPTPPTPPPGQYGGGQPAP